MDLAEDRIFLGEVRLATFNTWPYGDEAKCNKKKMAEAGFYKRKGSPDEDISALCFLCEKEMDGWEIDDDPWLEHISHASYCKFAQIGKAQEDMTVREFCQILLEYRITKIKKILEQSNQALERQPREMESKLVLH